MNKVIERGDLPAVVINLLTHNRTDLAVRTIHQALRHLKYDGDLRWFVCSHDSTDEHLAKTSEAIPDRYYWGMVNIRGNICACWNRGLEKIVQHTDYYIRLEDDMCLKADLDITRYVKVMMTVDVASMIRLGQMVTGLHGQTWKFRIDTHIGFEEDMYFHVFDDNQYAFSGHPALMHKRFHNAYGLYSERPMTAGELEVDMDNRIKHVSPGVPEPWILYPLDLGCFGTWGAWDHIGVNKA